MGKKNSGGKISEHVCLLDIPQNIVKPIKPWLKKCSKKAGQFSDWITASIKFCYKPIQESTDK